MKKTLTSRFLLFSFLIVLFAFGIRMFRLSTPKDFYFDEVYHGFTAKMFLHNDPKGYEYWQTPPEGVAYEWTHPPLAKLLMAAGMMVFGENSFGWRISSALAGTGVVAMVGVLTQKLFKRKKMTLLALLFAASDGLLLSMSRIAMNDMHFLFFGLLSVYFYIDFRTTLFLHEKSKQTIQYAALSFLFLGLALASKWTALYLGFALGLDTVAALITFGKFPIKTLILSAIAALLIIPIVYFGSYTQFFLEGHTLTQWKETTQQMWWYHTGLKATHPYQSRPIQWITDTRPVWMSVDYSQNDKNLVSNIYNVGNPILFWTGLVSVFFLTITSIRVGVTRFSHFLFEKKLYHGPKLSWEVWFPLFLYGSLWIPWQFSPRIMFFYHYAPALPFLCILSSYGVIWTSEHHKKLKLPLLLLVLATFLAFISLYPLNTGYPMQGAYFDKVFSFFPSWK
jgi:dolichyl-phosphate-mannose--protein O-mannosyl transferase